VAGIVDRLVGASLPGVVEIALDDEERGLDVVMR
jgi:hypothetical protein